MTSNSISNRKSARESLVTALQTITGLQAVFDHLPKDLHGQSPICIVFATSQMTEFMPAVMERFQFVVEVWAYRDGAAGASMDAAGAEDVIDDLAQDVTEVIAGWHNAFFYQPSEAGYEIMENGSYKVETFYVQVDWE